MEKEILGKEIYYDESKDTFNLFFTMEDFLDTKNLESNYCFWLGDYERT
jgi:hypothetical protein